ncbi:MAG: glutathione S-transferase family protein [Lentilitoribacter sp.]
MPEIEPKDPSLKSLDGVHLWHAPMSSCSQRVRITLAESDQSFSSHIIDLEKDEHASPEYQRIHPKGLVPALVYNGRLIIESIDIIRHVAGKDSPLSNVGSQTLLEMADDAQLDLKLLTFEFLFKGGPAPSSEEVEVFQKNHKNEWLQQFRIDFAKGFDPVRINDAIARTDAGFQYLETTLSDGRAFIEGDEFTLSDIAWMPNIHRFKLMDWPFERTPHLQRWFDNISERSSYQEALLKWQPEPAAQSFSSYTKQRQGEGTDIRSFPHFN